MVQVPAGDIADFENGTVPDKYDPAFQALDIYSNAGLFATAQGMNTVIPVGAVGATIILGDTSELNINFELRGSGLIVFGGSPAPDSFDVSATYPDNVDLSYGTADHRTATAMWPLVDNPVFNDMADWFISYSRGVYVEGPFYTISRTFGTNGRTQNITLTVDRVADTSITLDGRGGSDQYHVALGLGTFLNVTVADSDPSTQNSLVVDSRQTGFFNDRVTLTDTSLKVEYYTPIQYVWTGTDSYDYASVAYSPTVFFSANTDITFATADPFEQTIVNRVAGLQAAAIRFDGQTGGDIGLGYIALQVAYDPEQPNAVVHVSHLLTGITPTLDIQASAGSLVVERAPLTGTLDINVMANSGHLTFNDSEPWTGTVDTYTVVDNAGQLDVNYEVDYAWNSAYVQGLVHTLNILGNSGVINLQDTVNPALDYYYGVVDVQVNVGSSGSLADVHGVINLSSSNGRLALTLDDRNDAGPDLPWAIDATNTTIGDLTVNYVPANSVPDYSSSYQAFSNPGSAVAVFGDPPFYYLSLNDTQFPAWSLDGPAVLSNQKGDVVSIPPSIAGYSGAISTYTASDLPPGLSIDSTTGVISGVVDEQAPLGVYHTVLTASDGSFTRSKRIDWHITQITLEVPSIYLSLVGDSVDLLVTATSPSAGDITFSATNLPDGLSIDPATGQISGTVGPAGASLTYDTTITATQGGDVSAKSFQWTILPADFVDDIVIYADSADGSPPDQITLEGGQGFAAFYATNSLIQLPLQVSVTGLPPGVVLDTEYAADFQVLPVAGRCSCRRRQ